MLIEDVRNDPMLQALKRLRVSDVDDARAARIRQRCHRELRPRGWRAAANRSAISLLAHLLEPAVLALCAVYLSEVVRRALSLLQ